MIYRIIRPVLIDESGATAIQYGLVVSLISLGAIAVFNSIGDQVDALFTGVSENAKIAIAALDN